VSRAARHGADAGARIADLQRRLELCHAEREHLETEHARYAGALRQIASAESGIWGRIAHDALHPPADQDAA
jgi:hypothetical protein